MVPFSELAIYSKIKTHRLSKNTVRQCIGSPTWAHPTSCLWPIRMHRSFPLQEVSPKVTFYVTFSMQMWSLVAPCQENRTWKARVGGEFHVLKSCKVSFSGGGLGFEVINVVDVTHFLASEIFFRLKSKMSERCYIKFRVKHKVLHHQLRREASCLSRVSVMYD